MNLELQVSKKLKQYVLAVHIFAGLAVLLAQLSLVVKGVLLLFLGFSLHKHSKVSSTRITRLERSPEQGWTISYADEQQLKKLALTSSWVSNHMIILYLKSALRRGHIPVLIVSDMLDADRFRKLRVSLRHSKAEDK